MDNLNILIDDFLDELSNDKRIISLKESYDNIRNNEILSKELEEFNNNKYNNSLKEELSNSSLIINTHKLEGDCNYIILSINKELGVFKREKGSCYENN